jgi:purine-binding chemotaxis protein CheW
MNETNPQQAQNFIVFNVGATTMALALSSVRSVESWTTPTHLPRAPKHVLGLVSVRGSIVPVADLAVVFGIARATEASVERKLLMVSLGSIETAFKIDGSIDLLSASRLTKSNSSVNRGEVSLPFVEQIVECQDRLIHVIDLEMLLLSTAGGFEG